jgi:hypothetical protein
VLKTRNTPKLEQRIAEKYDLWAGKAKSSATTTPEQTENNVLKTQITALESRLAKIESTDTVKTELALKEAEPIKDKSILTK